MTAGRNRRGLAIAAALVLGIAAPATADGLAKFEKSIKPQLPPGSLTYKSAKGLGDNGFILEGVVVTAPPDTPGGKAEPVAIKRISVEDFDFANFEKQLPPNFAKTRVEGIAIVGKPAEGIDLKELAGIDKINADFQLDYRLDPERKTLTLNRLELDLSGLARIELSMILDGVSPEAAGNPDAAMNDASLRTASFVYEDRSILAKVMPAIAKMQGGDPAATIALAKAMLAPLRAGQGPATQAAFDALESFLDDYKQPKGPLRLAFNPPGKISAATLSGAAGADDVIKALGIVVSYAGTVPRKAPAAAAPAAPASTPPASTGAAGKSACTPGARFFVLNDDAWWSATARDAAASGKECIARLDGSGADVVVTLDKTMAWSIDGPGKLVDKCQSGDKVLVETDGGWYPAKIADKGGSAGKCPVKYDDPSSDDEAVPLKRVRRVD